MRFMKNSHQYLIAIIFCLFASVYLNAYNNSSKHYIVLSFAGGYSGFLNDYTHLISMDASNWDLSLGYEYEYFHFISQTGVGVRTRFADVELDNYQTSIFTYDTQGKLFEYVYQFTNRYDQSTEWSLDVPLLVGAKFSCFYFLAGIINNIHFYEHYKINVRLTCKGRYDRYVGDYVDMDNHAFYTNEPLQRKSQKSYIFPRYQLYPYLELGVDLVNALEKERYGRRKLANLQVRIAAFAHIAALNSYTKHAYDFPYLIDKDYPFDVSKIEIPAVCNSSYVTKTFNRDWTVGVKFSVLFNVSSNSRSCAGCGYRR